MKQFLVLLGCVFLLLGGCQEPGRNKSGVEVIIEGDGEFPEFLVGRWKANRGGWEFVFGPKGRISSAVVSMGRVRMKPGEVTTIPMKMGGKGIFEPGEWLVHYAPNARELTVKISLKNFYAELGKYVLKGENTDIFVGPISEDGQIWSADWFGLGKYIAFISEPNEFWNAAEPEFRGSLIFEKVEQEKGESGG